MIRLLLCFGLVVPSIASFAAELKGKVYTTPGGSPRAVTIPLKQFNFHIPVLGDDHKQNATPRLISSPESDALLTVAYGPDEKPFILKLTPDLRETRVQGYGFVVPSAPQDWDKILLVDKNRDTILTSLDLKTPGLKLYARSEGPADSAPWAPSLDGKSILRESRLASESLELIHLDDPSHVVQIPVFPKSKTELAQATHVISIGDDRWFAVFQSGTKRSLWLIEGENAKNLAWPVRESAVVHLFRVGGKAILYESGRGQAGQEFNAVTLDENGNVLHRFGSKVVPSDWRYISARATPNHLVVTGQSEKKTEVLWLNEKGELTDKTVGGTDLADFGWWTRLVLSPLGGESIGNRCVAVEQRPEIKTLTGDPVDTLQKIIHPLVVNVVAPHKKELRLSIESIVDTAREGFSDLDKPGKFHVFTSRGHFWFILGNPSGHLEMGKPVTFIGAVEIESLRRLVEGRK